MVNTILKLRIKNVSHIKAYKQTNKQTKTNAHTHLYTHLHIQIINNPYFQYLPLSLYSLLSPPPSPCTPFTNQRTHPHPHKQIINNLLSPLQPHILTHTYTPFHPTHIFHLFNISLCLSTASIARYSKGENNVRTTVSMSKQALSLKPDTEK